MRRHAVQEQREAEHFQMLVKPTSRTNNKKVEPEAETKESHQVDTEVVNPFMAVKKSTKLLGKRRRAVDEIETISGLYMSPLTQAELTPKKENQKRKCGNKRTLVVSQNS